MVSGMTRTQSYTLGFLALVVVTVGVGWLGKSMIDGVEPSELEFWHAGYYRDDAMNRLFTIGFLPRVGEAEIRRYAKQLTYTPGHTTVAFFYVEGSRIPGAGITNATSLADAKQALRTLTGASPWRYATLKDEAGVLRLVDCTLAPNDALCRH
jgi:hypothetical protein